MADVINLYAESGRNIIGDDSSAALDLSNSSTGNALSLHKDVGAAATIAVLKINASTASAPALEFAGSCVESTASGSASLTFGIRVKVGNLYGWIPVYEQIA